MQIKRLITVSLLAFVFLSIAFLVYKEFAQSGNKIANPVADTKNLDTSTLMKSPPVNTKSAEKEMSSKPQNAVQPVQPDPQTTPKSKVIAYYFHGTYRCSTCRTIEQYSREVIEKYFSKELRDGRLEFKPLNVEEPENRHYIQDYQLFSKSLVLSLVTDGKEIKWKNLTDVWTYVRDKEKFFKYVKDETESFLKG